MNQALFTSKNEDFFTGGSLMVDLFHLIVSFKMA